MEAKEKSVFETLNAIDCSEHIETKQQGGKQISYLSWAWAWGIVKKHFPCAMYTIYENGNGMNYHTDGRTAWVKTGVTINEQEYVEYLPVMDFKNNSITIDRITSFDVNKAIQRSLTKACARHGLGLYIYAGEDIPEETKEQQQQAPIQQAIAEANACKTTEELRAVWNKFPSLAGCADFKRLVTERNKQLQAC